MKNNTKNLTLPSCKTQRAEFLSRHSDVTLQIVATKSASLILDDDDADFINIPCGLSSDDVAKIIATTNPDIAIAASGHCAPYDWDMIFDSLVASRLEQMGFKVIAPNVEFAAMSFDKRETHATLKDVACMPRFLFFNRALMLSDSGVTDVTHNVYKDYLFSELQKMQYPLVIKDNAGVSSINIEVSKTFGEAKTFLRSKRCKCDKIIEEYVAGEQFSLEVYCFKGECIFGPLVKLSLNQYGVTSPRFNTKVTYKHSDESSLRAIIKNIVKKFSLSGVIQFDLVYNITKECAGGSCTNINNYNEPPLKNVTSGHWVVIEINARPGGVTLLSAAAMGLNIFELLTLPVIKSKIVQRNVIEEKIDIANTVTVQSLDLLKNIDLSKNSLDNPIFIFRTENPDAKQFRERGYCAIIKSYP